MVQTLRVRALMICATIIVAWLAVGGLIEGVPAPPPSVELRLEAAFTERHGWPQIDGAWWLLARLIIRPSAWLEPSRVEPAFVCAEPPRARGDRAIDRLRHEARLEAARCTEAP